MTAAAAAAAAVQSRKSAQKRSRSPGKRLGSRKRQTSASDNLEKEVRARSTQPTLDYIFCRKESDTADTSSLVVVPSSTSFTLVLLL